MKKLPNKKWVKDDFMEVSRNFPERSLSDLEALLQALNSTAIVSETDVHGKITFVNDKFIEISKYSKEELVGKNHRILKSGYHTPKFYMSLWRTILGGRVWRGIIKNKAKDGSFYWVDTSIAPILSSGKPKKFISVRFPITERQKAEEELRKRAKQQGVLTDLSQEALANYNLNELFGKASRSLSETLDLPYCVIFKLQPGGKHLSFEAGVGFTRVKPGKTMVSAEDKLSMAGFTLASKEPIVMEDLSSESRFTGSSLLHDNNVVSGVSVIIHGTERPFGIMGAYSAKKRTFTKEDVDFIQAIANLLANAVRNQLDKRKDEFLGVASHELKTPLTSIKTFVQMLEENSKKQKDERSLLFLEKVDAQVDKLTGLINDLLDISRINSGKLELKKETFKISDLLSEITSEHQLLAKKHKILFKNGVSQKVVADKFRITQVIINLLNNAIKYSPNSDEIIVRADQVSDRIIVSVRDFGVGVPVSEQGNIFDRFFQGAEGRKDDFPGGLGLGLFISSQIIKLHGGQIWVESKVGKGSTFSFAIPIKTEDVRTKFV